MKLIRCQMGHFYDSEKYSECPHCSGEGANGGDNLAGVLSSDDMVTVKKSSEGITPTEAINQSKPSKTLAEQITSAKPSAEAYADDAKTIGVFKKNLSKDDGCEPVVGWLVCTSGAHYGNDFRLHAGRNFIGRSNDMDICLNKDGTISREKHMVILYEPKANIFMVQPGDSKELSYLNDDVILDAKIIKAYDVVSAGETQLMFIPFCSDSYKWADNKTEEQK